jgi:hypothetical protein
MGRPCLPRGAPSFIYIGRNTVKKFIVGAISVFALVLSGISTSNASPIPNLSCDGVYSGTYHNVTVPEGASCTLTADSVITGGVHAKRGALNLFDYSATGHNVMAMGVVHDVVIGTEGCKYDPPVGNNVMVKFSHNVLICYVAADNNIVVTGNDGKITVRDSSAGNNIMVNRNKKYVADGPVKHKRAGAIRLLRLTAGGHVTSKHNHHRLVIRKDIVSGH